MGCAVMLDKLFQLQFLIVYFNFLGKKKAIVGLIGGSGGSFCGVTLKEGLEKLSRVTVKKNV